MSLSTIASRVGRTISDNSPAILTALGVTGVVSTAWLTARASFQTAEALEEHKGGPDDLTAREKVEIAWEFFIPPVLVGGSTIAAIVLANRIEHKRATALAAAFTLSREALDEYRAKVVEKIGEKKEMEIREEIARDRVNSPIGGVLVVNGSGDQLCHEAYTNQFFSCNMQKLQHAVNEVNSQIRHHEYATMNDFYDRVGLPHTTGSGEFGWNHDQLLDIMPISILVEKGPYQGQTALSFDYMRPPVYQPWRYI